METRIQAIHFDITSRLTEFINRKVDRLTRRYPAISDVDTTLKVVKPETAMNKQAIVKVTIPGAPELVADKTANTFEEAVDLCIDALDRQLEKKKDK
ncbi:MAG: ribosome-associated translation inhibitor RaiA [Muribaculaceae bacterium]|nr:ribosome-associated translation inhibitor RaiA [Muribaculaceae bacterium]